MLKHGANVEGNVNAKHEYNALMVAVDQAHVDTSRLLLSWGANVNHYSYDGVCCYQEVTFKFVGKKADKSLRIIKLLLLYGANIRDKYLRDDYLTTPMNIAINDVEGKGAARLKSGGHESSH